MEPSTRADSTGRGVGRRRQGLPSAWFKLAQKLRQFYAAGEKELTAKLRVVFPREP